MLKNCIKYVGVENKQGICPKMAIFHFKLPSLVFVMPALLEITNTKKVGLKTLYTVPSKIKAIDGKLCFFSSPPAGTNLQE